MENPLDSDKTMVLRPAAARGHATHGWLNSYHTFSFADYYDPKHMGFRSLRVINEDRIQGGMGFGVHPHADMEIISYVVSGGLEHKDSMGNKTVILPDEVQIMSAGNGVTHAEMNHFKDQETHFFQIWILPAKKGSHPRYGQRSFKAEFAKQDLTLVVSQDKRNGSLGIDQDVDIHIGRLKTSKNIDLKVRSGRHLWVQMISGEVEISKVILGAGDGLTISNVNDVPIEAKKDAEFILFDLN